MESPTEYRPRRPAQRRLLTPDEAAERLRRAPATLRNWRHKGEGPRYVKCGGRVHYTEAALDAWITSHEVDPNGSGADQ